MYLKLNAEVLQCVEILLNGLPVLRGLLVLAGQLAVPNLKKSCHTPKKRHCIQGLGHEIELKHVYKNGYI
jgi:hypothetical protein